MYLVIDSVLIIEDNVEKYMVCIEVIKSILVLNEDNLNLICINRC